MFVVNQAAKHISISVLLIFFVYFKLTLNH